VNHIEIMANLMDCTTNFSFDRVSSSAVTVCRSAVETKRNAV